MPCLAARPTARNGERIAELMQYALLKGSFIPPPPIRELRDLTRRRRTLVGDGAAEKNRVQKILEDANVKLGNVLLDVFGTSGQAMLEALLENKQSAAEIAELGQLSDSGFSPKESSDRGATNPLITGPCASSRTRPR